MSGSQEDGEFVGKYESSGRIGQILINRFFDAVTGLVRPCLGEVRGILEVGCGPGYSTQRLAALAGERRLIASDISPGLLARARMLNPDIPLISQSVFDLAHPNKSFDLVVMLEVLEHLDRPAVALQELHRVCSRFLVLSTPREPIWRMLNCARGKYLKDLGNTPGHVQHWSSRGLVAEVSPYFEVIAVARPLPWTVLLLAPRE
ncbi:MAG: class I SAM-dependent methyltransferase [Wenzhouxiangella sp.]|nr:class I SAM-dependent methyltransferase [Wenzhouxiangella sp.]